ncbi:hypothetical protein [Tsuneonella sp. HG222]
MLLVALVFALGTANFALHKAVLESGHPAIEHLAPAVRKLGGRGTLALEFILLLAALLAVAGGASLWGWIYLGYSLLNGLGAWLILAKRR